MLVDVVPKGCPDCRFQLRQERRAQKLLDKARTSEGGAPGGAAELLELAEAMVRLGARERALEFFGRARNASSDEGERAAIAARRLQVADSGFAIGPLKRTHRSSLEPTGRRARMAQIREEKEQEQAQRQAAATTVSAKPKTRGRGKNRR